MMSNIEVHKININNPIIYMNMSICYFENQNNVFKISPLIKTGLFENKCIDLRKINSFNRVREGIFKLT